MGFGLCSLGIQGLRFWALCFGGLGFKVLGFALWESRVLRFVDLGFRMLGFVLWGV